MKPGLKTMALTALVSLNLTLAPGVAPQEAQQQQPSSLPDGPAPQPQQVPLTSLTGPIKPGGGAGTESNGSSSSSGSPNQPPAPEQPPPPARDEIQTTPPEVPPAGEGFDKTQTVIRLNVNFVEVPVTVKDSKGGLVAGLTFRDFQVYENEQREPLRLFTVDPFPLSIAFLVDQSVTADVMTKVNDSLGAIQGALTPYDEVAVFTYNNGAQNRSGGFTGAQSTRVPYVLAMTKAAGAGDACSHQQRPASPGAASLRTGAASIPMCSRAALRGTAPS